MNDRVVVWGNCQAAPLADLLRPTMLAAGLIVEPVPPVYLVDEPGLREVQALLRRCAVLVTQPIRDEYRVAGCGSGQLAALLPAGARTVRVPVVYDVGPFPYQVRGYDDTGRVDAPVTDYHDLRMVLAAEAGWSVDRTLETWPHPSSAAVREVAQASTLELRRREAGLDVVASDLLGTPDAMWTMTHPANVLLAEVARRVLAALGMPDAVTPPQREYLAARRTPVDNEVAQALGWPVRPGWVVDGRAVPPDELAAAHLEFYAARPAVVTHTLRRAATRLDLLRRDQPMRSP